MGWYYIIMKRFHLTSKQLQSVNIDLGTVNSLYRSLILYVSSMRDMCDVYEKSKTQINKQRILRYNSAEEKTEINECEVTLNLMVIKLLK